MIESFFIIVPFLNDFEPSSGTTIRIAGYTRSLEELGADYRFLSAVRPGYVPPEKHEPLTFSRKWIKVILVHNLLFSKPWLRPLSAPLRFLLDNVAGIREISRKINDRLIWAHQENTLALYLNLRYSKSFIYDVHGFFSVQDEYRNSLNSWRKIWFDLYEKHEIIVLKNAAYINVVSEETKLFVHKCFDPPGMILLAPDGIPGALPTYKIKRFLNRDFRLINNIPENKKIILFAGSFKIMGGVTELVKAYLDDKKLQEIACLVLIGKGQEEEAVSKLLRTSNLSNQVILLDSMPHNELVQVMLSADVLVCPDKKGNLYNEMTPHIKLFDAIASEKNVVATDFMVNKRLFPEAEYNIFYFSGDGNYSLRKALHLALENAGRKINHRELEKHTYLNHTKNYLTNFQLR